MRPPCALLGVIGSTPPLLPRPGKLIEPLSLVVRMRRYSFHEVLSVGSTVLKWSLPPVRKTQTKAR